MAGIVAIGASQGGVHALRALVGGLAPDFPVPVVVVLHIGASESLLPSLLSELGGLQASHARDGEPLRPGHIHVAPANHHLLVEDGHLRLSRGPRENWARPAIDPLFRSVAQVCGRAAIGVILSGALNDGAAGLYAIKQNGGTAVVQDPDEAEAPSMPRSALDNVDIDYCMRIESMAPLLTRLARKLENQGKGLRGGVPMPNQEHALATPIAQSCPECGGAMREELFGPLRQFRCHIGHVMTAEILAAAKLERLEYDISACVRAANERVELCREIAAKHEAQGKTASAGRWRKAADEAEARAALLEEFAEREWYDPESRLDPDMPQERKAQRS